MRKYSPASISAYTALLVSGITAASSAVISFWQLGEVHWLMVATSAAVSFGLSYLVVRLMVERFVYDRIRLIYKTIHNIRSVKARDQIDAALQSQDPIETVSEEVLDWAQNRGEELESLKKQEEFRREFIGNLAHELKTPIFNMQGYLFTLLEGGLDDDNVNYDYLVRTDKNLERLVDLVEDLDSITKLESGNEVIRWERFDLVEMAQDCMNSLELKAGHRSIQLKFRENYDKPIWVKGDRSRIMQVVSNLLVNSINYGRDNGETEVRFYDMDLTILIEIADNGMGIEEKHLPRLFERFYRIDKSRARDQGGSGLGLSIVKHIIESHSQTINVRSTEGVGSTFSFTLEKAR